MADIPVFKSTTDEDTYQTIFLEKLNNYSICMNAVRGKYYPNYNWDQLTGETFSVIQEITSELIYNSTREFEKKVPGYELDPAVYSNIDL